MHTILTVVGARPQFIKAAAINRVIREQHSRHVREVYVHTGQHYDANMSAVFFTELGLPPEDHNLGVGSGSHARQTADMLIGIERVLLEERPDLVLLYGDTNSTVAGALAASKLHIPIAHVEGGVRSHHKAYPEEVNRLICDHLSTLVFCPTEDGMTQLAKEGLHPGNQRPWSADRPGVFHCGDIMYDNSLYFAERAEATSQVLQRCGVTARPYALATIHRPHNTDHPQVLADLMRTFIALAEARDLVFVIPMHPRTLLRVEEDLEPTLRAQLREHPLLRVIPAVPFLDMVQLERHARIVLTDSGGVQKEAYFFRRPAVILLDRTPWVELTASGTAIETGADPQRIRDAFLHLLDRTDLVYPPIFGDGRAAHFICDRLLELLDERAAQR
ncbi:MAG TPA: UDP-N-acetylglucosamine 2-epimerase (non-hydrolyzing) [Flavobacteriales bacterium]